MTTTVEFSNDARRMLDDADERWVAEHGYFAANPLVEEAERATELLRHNPDLGVRFRGARGRQPEIRRLLLQTGWHLYYSVDASRSHVGADQERRRRNSARGSLASPAPSLRAPLRSRAGARDQPGS